nr:hypothetical protein [Paracidovorax cattleyae]
MSGLLALFGLARTRRR